MFLKSIQLCGFKSFTDRTELDLSNNVVGIVGPNGCGKSNVIDAVRWCLGETSARSLRSGHLVDVIFNGSTHHPPLNMAEVSLTFDNQHHVLPVDFSEVTVTRRVFRSGESEYFINKSPCRLKDIHDLFLDTGFGTDGYAIIEQGRVEYILNAKPDERRAMFEEAAGVAKYHARREEAERKLEKIEVDMSRLNDIIAMNKEQMDKLELAAKKARQYQKFAEELKTLEIGNWLNEIKNINAEKEALSSVISSHESEIVRLTTEMHTVSAVLNELRRQLADCDTELLTAAKERGDIETQLQLCREREAHARQAKQELEHRLKRLGEDLVQVEQKIAASHSEEEKFLAEFKLQEEQKEVLNRETGAKFAAYTETRTFFEDKETEAKTLQARLLAEAAKHAEIVNARVELKTAQSHNQAAKSAGSKQLERVNGEIAHTSEAAVRVTSELSALLKEIADVSNKNSELEENLAHVSSQKISRQKDLESLEKEVVGIEATIAASQSSGDVYAIGSKMLSDMGLDGIYGPLGELIKTDRECENLVKHALSEHLWDWMADDLDHAKKAVDLLNNNGKGRVRMWILDRLPHVQTSTFDQDVFQVSGQRPVMDMVRCDDKFLPLVRYLAGSFYAWDNTLYGNAYICGGAAFDAADAVGIANPLTIGKLKEELIKKAKVKEDLLVDLTNLNRTNSELLSEQQSLSQRFGEMRLQSEMLKAENDRLSAALKLACEERTLIEKDIVSADSAIAGSSVKIKEFEDMIAKLDFSGMEIRNRLEKMQVELASARENVALAMAEHSSARERGNLQAERVQFAQGMLERVRSDMNKVAVQKEYILTEKENVARKIEELEVIIPQAGSQQILLAAEEHKMQVKADEIVNRKRALGEDVRTRETSVVGLKDKISENERPYNEARMRLSHLAARLESVTGWLTEKYQLSPDTAREQYAAQIVEHESLEKLRRRVENLGAVNLAAPEEYLALEERFKFLLNQQEDLNKAQNDLKETIAKINQTTRDQFRDTFEKIRANFKEVYAKLFEGGDADLRYSDQGDELSAGVEILVQPPGKKLENIRQLSGGEKTLTAIALLFAFFLCRPSPIAILDEVDAALDEANVSRFIKMIEDFAVRSQFLIITHNKRMMEAVDTLYGVTMERRGISTFLSIRLKKETPETALVA